MSCVMDIYVPSMVSGSIRRSFCDTCLKLRHLLCVCGGTCALRSRTVLCTTTMILYCECFLSPAQHICCLRPKPHTPLLYTHRPTLPNATSVNIQYVGCRDNWVLVTGKINEYSYASGLICCSYSSRTMMAEKLLLRGRVRVNKNSVWLTRFVCTECAFLVWCATRTAVYLRLYVAHGYHI